MQPRESSDKGFGHSKRRIALEIGGIVLALALLVWGALWLAAALAGPLASLVPPSVEVALGEAAWSQVAPPSARCTNPEPERYVETIAAPLLEHVDAEGYTFEFTVVDRPEVNAFALPGGFVTVHMGLLDEAETGEEVAAVLAHEIAHVTERHGLRRILRQVGGATLIGLLTGWADVGVLVGVAEDVLSTAYDRDQERDADAVGRRLLVAAGIDPSGMATFFRRLEAQGPNGPAFLSTHPDPGERAEAAAAAKLEGPARALPPPTGLTCR